MLVFGDSPGRHRNIIIQNHTFEVVDTFKYLGVLFSKNRRFVKAKKHVVNKQGKLCLVCILRLESYACH